MCWDFDGLIVDTEWIEFEAWRDVFAQVGLDLTLDAYRPFAGTRRTSAQVLQYSRSLGFGGHDEELAEAFWACYRSKVADIPMRSGVEKLLAVTLEAGLANWVVSSSDVRTIETILEKLGIRRSFGGIVGGDVIKDHKPSPAPYLAALEQCNTRSREARALEDSEPGVRSAVAAGIPVFAVVNRVTCGQTFPASVPVVSSLDELSREWLIGSDHGAV